MDGKKKHLAAMTDNKILTEVKKISDGDGGSVSSKVVVISVGDHEDYHLVVLRKSLPRMGKKIACSTLDGDDVYDQVEKKNDKGMEEIVKQLKKVEKQNTITHCLLSVMILVTVAWQVSEASLILRVKNKLKNPFKSLWNSIKRAIAGGGTRLSAEERIGEQKCTSSSERDDSKSIVSDLCSQIEPPPIPELRMPDLAKMDLPGLGSNGGNDE